MVIERYCTKYSPMPLQEGPVAAERGVLWHHDQIVDLDPEDLLDSRAAPYMCLSCGYRWIADLGD